MNTLTLILLILVALLYLKWILIALFYPFMVLDGVYRNHPNALTRLLRLPFAVIKRVFRGWQKFMLYNVSTLPSAFLRRAIYKGLGAHIGKNAMFHFRTEIREPTKLHVGGGRLSGTTPCLTRGAV